MKEMVKVTIIIIADVFMLVLGQTEKQTEKEPITSKMEKAIYMEHLLKGQPLTDLENITTIQIIAFIQDFFQTEKWMENLLYTAIILELYQKHILKTVK